MSDPVGDSLKRAIFEHELGDLHRTIAELHRTLARECRARQAAEERAKSVKQAWERDLEKGREAFSALDAARAALAEVRDQCSELLAHAAAAHKVLDGAGAPHASDQHAIAYRIVELRRADRRWEDGFRNIAELFVGNRTDFDIPEIVRRVRRGCGR